MSQNSDTQLTYYFNKVQTFEYKDKDTLFGGDVIPITMTNNDSSKSVIKLTNTGTPNFYTLDSLYISLLDSTDAKYQLILKGNRNDYTNNSNRNILIIIPIFNTLKNTILEKETNIITKNNTYITSIINNIKQEPYMFPNDMVDINNLLTGIEDGSFYEKQIHTKPNAKGENVTTIYDIIKFTKSNIYADRLVNSNLENLKSKINEFTGESLKITISNNNGNISTTVADDIYIDCSPTNNIGQAVDVYTSKNLDQLNFFKVNDFNKTGTIISIIVILLLIVITVLKIGISVFPGELSKSVQKLIPSNTLDSMSSSSQNINIALAICCLILFISLLAFAIKSN
jgi:hypothetical protein